MKNIILNLVGLMMLALVSFLTMHALHAPTWAVAAMFVMGAVCLAFETFPSINHHPRIKG